MQKAQRTQVRSLGREDPLEEERATHPGILDWEIPWTEEPGRLQSTGLQRVGHDRATEHTFVFRIVLVILGCLDYHTKFSISLFIFAKIFARIFSGIALKLPISWEEKRHLNNIEFSSP